MSSIVGKITSLFKSFFARFAPILRDGLEAFLRDNLSAALEIAWDILSTQGFGSAHEFAEAFWKRLNVNIESRYGTWLTILGALALDAVKKAAQTDTASPHIGAARVNNPWLTQ